MIKKTLIGSGFAFLITGTLIFSNIYLVRLLFIGLLMILGLLALKELYELTKLKGCAPNENLSYFFSFLFFLSCTQPLPCLLPLTIALTFLFTLFVSYLAKDRAPIKNIAATILGFAYLTLPLSSILLIFSLFEGSTTDNQGRIWVLFLFIIKGVTDTFAFYTGKLFGGRRFAPIISPNKTWSGATGGFISAIIAGIIFTTLSQNKIISMEIHALEALFLAATLSILSQIGDLAESMLKRDAQVKDSHNLPGVGGILDAVDSLVFAAPFLYLHLLWRLYI